MTDCSKASFETKGYPYYFSKCYWQKEKSETLSMPTSSTKNTAGHPDTGISLSFKEKLQSEVENQKNNMKRESYQETVKFAEKELSFSKHSEKKLKKEMMERAKKGYSRLSLKNIEEGSGSGYDITAENPDTGKSESLYCDPLKKYFHYMKHFYSKDVADCLKFTDENYRLGRYCYIEADWSKDSKK